MNCMSLLMLICRLNACFSVSFNIVSAILSTVFSNGRKKADSNVLLCNFSSSFLAFNVGINLSLVYG